MQQNVSSNPRWPGSILGHGYVQSLVTTLETILTGLKKNPKIFIFHLRIYFVAFLMLLSIFLLFTKRQILDSSKLKEFADENFKIDKMGEKFPKWVENKHGEKMRNCSLRAITPFPTVFSKDLYSDTGFFWKWLNLWSAKICRMIKVKRLNNTLR